MQCLPGLFDIDGDIDHLPVAKDFNLEVLDILELWYQAENLGLTLNAMPFTREIMSPS